MPTFGELKRMLGRRRGFDGNVDRLADFINAGYGEVVGFRPDWPWTRREKQFQTRAPLSGTTTAGNGYTNGSNAVTGLPSSTVTRYGAHINSPDGAFYRIAASNSNGTTVQLPVPYPGATALAQAFKIYTLDYPLPPGMRGLYSVTITGNGYDVTLKEQSLLATDIISRPAHNYESVPCEYAVIQHSRLPEIRQTNALLTVIGGGSLSAGTYTYWVAYLNSATGEVGPLSPAKTIAPGATNRASWSMPTRWDLWRRVFRSRSGESIPYFLTDLGPTATLLDGADDDSLGLDPNGIEIGQYVENHGSHLLRLWPPPDNEYLVTVHYYLSPGDLKHDNDVPLCPVEMQSSILDFAEYYALGEEENHSAAAQKRAVAIQKIEQMAATNDVDESAHIELGGPGRPRTPVTLVGRSPRYATES
jgi:hypothetical protein